MAGLIKRILALTVLLLALSAAGLPARAATGLDTLDLWVNGVWTGEVGYLSKGGGVVVDAQALLGQVSGAQYSSMTGGSGFAVQYGDKISFVARNRASGFVSLAEVVLDYQLESAGGTLLAPLNFLAQSVGGSAEYDALQGQVRLQVTQSPVGIGGVIPQAADLKRELMWDFTVRQGEIGLANAIDICAAGYTPDCNGNNAGFPYLIIQSPTSPRDNQYAQTPFVFQMDRDEAMVAIGYTPPETTYFSYRSYLVNRYNQSTGGMNKIYASLGDTINNYNLAAAKGTDDVYGRFFVIVSTGDLTTFDRIKRSALNAGVAAEDIYLDIIPDELVDFGLEEGADGINFLHRASLFADADQKAAYLASPTLEILRATPYWQTSDKPLYQQPLRPRGTGVSEQEEDPRLADALEDLYQAILARHGQGKTATRLDTSVWLEEGNQAIADGTNVLGETRDTLYTRTDSFQFDQNDLIVVFGVNHTTTGKSVYSNVSCYGAQYYNGFGGITNQDYQGSAREYLPDLDPDLADKFYVWKFAHSDLGDSSTYVVNQDTDNNLTGINYGAEAFMGYRSYIDKPTLVGTVIGEIVRDQAVLLE